MFVTRHLLNEGFLSKRKNYSNKINNDQKSYEFVLLMRVGYLDIVKYLEHTKVQLLLISYFTILLYTLNTGARGFGHDHATAFCVPLDKSIC